MTPLPMQTQCGSKPNNTRRRWPVHYYYRRLLPILDACGAFLGTWTRCSRTTLYYTVKSAVPDPNAHRLQYLHTVKDYCYTAQ